METASAGAEVSHSIESRWSGLFGAAALLGAIASALAAMLLRAEPLRLDLPESVEVVRRARDAVGEARVLISNPCSFPIEILELTPTCTCTGLRIPEMVLKPGQSQPLEIEVRLDDEPTQVSVQIAFHAEGSSVVARRSLTVRAPAMRNLTITNAGAAAE